MSNNVEATRVFHHKAEPPEHPFAVISDIHANATALRCVLKDIDSRGIKRVVCLGDVMGYGPDPAECWRLVKERASVIIMGNHDLALIQGDMPRFHPRAKAAIEWTRRKLETEPDGEEIMNDIAELPRAYSEGPYLYVHGSPAGPTLDYLLPGDAFDAERMREEFALVRNYAFNGHSHIPGVAEIYEGFDTPEILGSAGYRLSGAKAIINVGSVGQPRDGNPKACYVSVTPKTVNYHRVSYDAVSVCERIYAEPELDHFLGRRLLVGH